jgi:hypothetical protein
MTGTSALTVLHAMEVCLHIKFCTLNLLVAMGTVTVMAVG